jgi:hypothetical protein
MVAASLHGSRLEMVSHTEKPQRRQGRQLSLNLPGERLNNQLQES